MLNVDRFSPFFRARHLDENDAKAVYRLCRTNPLYYAYCPPEVTLQSVLEDMRALPPGKTPADKYFIGFFEGDRLIAVLDLIAGYPEESNAFIGFFMTDAGVQGKGTGSALIRDLLAYLAEAGFASVRLAWVKGNPQAEHFWRKNGFTPLRETSSNAAAHVILAEKRLDTDR